MSELATVPQLTTTTLLLAGAGELMILPFAGATATGVPVTVPPSMLNAAGQLVDPLAAQLAALSTPIVRSLLIKEVYQRYTTAATGLATAQNVFKIAGLVGADTSATTLFTDVHTVADTVLGAVFLAMPSTKLVTTGLPYTCAPGPVKPIISTSSGTVSGYIAAAWVTP